MLVEALWRATRLLNRVPVTRDALPARGASAVPYRALFDNGIDPTLLVRLDGQLLRANAAACVMFGMSEGEIRGRGWLALLGPGDARLQAWLAEFSRTGKAQGELRVVRGDGSLLEAELVSTPYIAGDDTIHALIVVRDISERLKLRAEISRLNAELERFAYSLAHDLRAPIGVIEGFSAILAHSKVGHDSERNGHYLRRIRTAAKQMGDYTEALLSLARVSQETLQSVDTDLSAVAAAVLADLQERDGGRVLVARVQKGLRVRGDPCLLKMALENMLGNAWKFTSQRDVAKISFGAKDGAGGQKVYYVKDNGAGFDMLYSGKLFGNFQRLHSQSEFPGTGIGLANVHRIIVRHGGRVWAESVEGKGATFYFTLAAQSDRMNSGPNRREKSAAAAA